MASHGWTTLALCLAVVSCSISAALAGGSGGPNCKRPTISEKMVMSLERSRFVAGGRFEAMGEPEGNPLPDDPFGKRFVTTVFAVDAIYKGERLEDPSIGLRFSIYPALPVARPSPQESTVAPEPLVALAKQLRDLEQAYAQDCLSNADFHPRNERLIEAIRRSPEFHAGGYALVNVVMGPIGSVSRRAQVLVEAGKEYVFMMQPEPSGKSLREARVLDFDLYSEGEIEQFGKGVLASLREKKSDGSHPDQEPRK